MKRYKTPTVCEQCGKKFEKETYDFKRTKHNFCSKKCRGEYQTLKNTILVFCEVCKKRFNKIISQANKSKSGKHFCSQSCAASYNNTLKRKTRRSKIEIKLFQLLKKEFPFLEILPNDKTMLEGLEIDIAIPSLKLGVEWNGIVHFKPIYGKEKLQNIQKKDQRKLKIASNKDINLIVISDLVSNDVMLQKAFEQCSEIIKEIIMEGTGNDPARP